MNTPLRKTSMRALRDLAALWTAAAVAASAWASGIHEEGYILESADWRSEIAGTPSPDWPVDGWYRITPSGRKTVDVRPATPSQAESGARDPDGALYVRVPATSLKEGARPKVRFAANELRPKVGVEYHMVLAGTPFSFLVHSDPDGTHYDIHYGGQTHSYRLGLPAAATLIHAISDLDGDRMPDFLLEVGDDTYLLLSTQAQPGGNLPSAQLWAMGC